MSPADAIADLRRRIVLVLEFQREQHAWAVETGRHHVAASSAERIAHHEARLAALDNPATPFIRGGG